MKAEPHLFYEGRCEEALDFNRRALGAAPLVSADIAGRTPLRVERRVALFKLVDDAQALQIVLETAVGAHAIVERILAGVAERRMPQVVRQRNGFGEVFVEAQRARDAAGDLRHFKRVRQPRAKKIALVINEDLSLVFKAPESR